MSGAARAVGGGGHAAPSATGSRTQLTQRIYRRGVQRFLDVAAERQLREQM